MNKDEMTKRILKVMDNEYLTIFGHPTARLIGKRDPVDFDFDNIFEKSKKNGILLEINSNPERLDLKDIHIKMAKDYGNKFVIDTDSHSIENMHFMELGIGQARRGWLESKDVVNTYSLIEFKKSLGLK